MDVAKLYKIISEVLNIEADANTSFAEISSLKKLQIIMALDEEGINVPIEKLAKIKLMSDLLAIAVVE